MTTITQRQSIINTYFFFTFSFFKFFLLLFNYSCVFFLPINTYFNRSGWSISTLLYWKELKIPLEHPAWKVQSQDFFWKSQHSSLFLTLHIKFLRNVFDSVLTQIQKLTLFLHTSLTIHPQLLPGWLYLPPTKPAACNPAASQILANVEAKNNNSVPPTF